MADSWRIAPDETPPVTDFHVGIDAANKRGVIAVETQGGEQHHFRFTLKELATLGHLLSTATNRIAARP